MIEAKRVDQASKMAARWLVKSCQITDSGDPNLGAFRTRYDAKARKLTLDPQAWQTSEAIRALLKLYGRTGNQTWKDSAVLGGRYLRWIQCTEEDGEEAGSLWRPWLGGDQPLSVAANYQSVVGLLDLYAATGAPCYLDAAKKAGDWFLRRAYRGGGTHLNLYLADKGVFGWPRSHIVDEGSFLRLHDLTREEAHASVLQDQIQGLLSSFEPSGWFSCMLAPRMERDEGVPEGCISLRSVYWHLAPLLMAYGKRGTQSEILNALQRSALLAGELQDGEGFLCRSFLPEGPRMCNAEPDGVATAMFVLIWLRLCEATKESAYLDMAERGLSWILDSQFVVRREMDAFGAFFQERVELDGELRPYLGGLASSYGILACEEYLRLHGRR